MTEVTIRAFSPDDWNAVCDLYERSARSELAEAGIDPRAFRPLPEEEDLDEFQWLNTTRVACVEHQIVGFIAWRGRGEWEGSGYLSFLYVDPGFHQRGIGDRLVEDAMPELGDQAWTLVKAGNTPAIRLYEKHGMQIVRSRQASTGAFPHTELRMALPSSRKSDPDLQDFGAGD